jgi:hypothetical protein
MRRFYRQLQRRNMRLYNCKNNSVLAIRQTEFELSAEVLQQHNIANSHIDLLIQSELSIC